MKLIVLTFSVTLIAAVINSQPTDEAEKLHILEGNVEGKEFDTEGLVAGKPLTQEDFKRAGELVDDETTDIDFIDRAASDGSLISERTEGEAGWDRWPSTQIAYKLDSTFDDDQRAHIAKAMLKLEEYSCIRFVPWKTEHDKKYIWIWKNAKKNRCFASLGYKKKASMEDSKQRHHVSLGDNCFVMGTYFLVHEFMHVLGFPHEHNRPDRDDHITVNWDNLLDDKYTQSAYKITNDFPEILLAMPYDQNSIMHYNKYQGGKSPTMEAKDGGVVGPTHNGPTDSGTHLSKLDIMKIDYWFKCGACHRRKCLTHYRSAWMCISSQNYPKHYPNYLDCEFTIEAIPGYAIHVNFIFFDLEKHSNCEYDYLKISDKEGNSYGPFCGEYLPDPLTIYSEEIYIRFHSDYSVTKSGYKLEYTSGDCYDGIAGFYNGQASTTLSGNTCQRWDVSTPHQPMPFAQDKLNFPQEDMAHNYCRNPGWRIHNGTERPWCYTTDPNEKYGYCGIEECGTMV